MFKLKLGNDIVNLTAPRAANKYLNHKFLNRVFTNKEQDIIESFNNPNDKSKIFWAIWAAKEASFKACQKQNPELIFAHRKFEITFNPELTNIRSNSYDPKQHIIGTAYYEDKLLTIKCEFTENLVHSIAVLLDPNTIFNNFDKINYNIFTVDSENHIKESLSTRFYAKQFLISCGFSESIEIIRKNMIVNNTKRYGPPTVFMQDRKLSTIEISLSHDHGLGAIAFTDLKDHLKV